MNFLLFLLVSDWFGLDIFSQFLIALGLSGLLFYLDPQFPLLARAMKRQMIGNQIPPIFQHLSFPSYSYNVVKFS